MSEGEEQIIDSRFSLSLINPYREDPKPDPNRDSINGESNGVDLSPDTVPVVDSPDTTVIQNCHCGKCPVMKDRSEQVCCKIEKSWQEKYNSSGEVKCLTDCPNFVNICNKDHFRLVKDLMNSIFHDDDESEDLNRRLRKAAYKSTVFFLRGRMGEGNRLIIPACCKAKIRDLCPNPAGVPYVGHKWF